MVLLLHLGPEQQRSGYLFFISSFNSYSFERLKGVEIHEVQQTFIASVVDTFSVISHRDMFVVGTRPLVDKRKKIK